MGKEIVSRRGDGAKGRHSEETEAKVGGEGSRVGAVDAILIPARVANDSEVGSEADTVGTMRVHVRGGSNVERLDLNAGPDTRRIHAQHNNVGAMEETRPGASPPVVHAPPPVTARPPDVRNHTTGAEDGLEGGGVWR